MDNIETIIQIVSIALIPVIFAIVLHEVAHGWIAKQLGDNTAYSQGRLTLNPIKHIDPIGTILVPILLYMTAGFAFGWAKPVPINWRNLRHPKRDMVYVALAGPAANLLMAVFWGIVLKIASMFPTDSAFAVPLSLMATIGIGINIILMIFNLFPLPPLDGGRVAVGLLPPKPAYYLSRLEPYGFIIILVLLATGVLGYLITPVIGLVLSLIAKLTGM